ncbi:flagellar motor switch protein FliG [Azospirillum brasilense]|uniref:flagellar motor switch protein FliG n=1 Tax=Azospirillum brasilense TaxID=192 RepID=UPI001FE251BA|nr:FliG C-terminal domain-containing protein [Azospirillum brasilense]
MSNVNEGVLATYLAGEYPQTAAVILSRMRSDHAAKVLPLLAPALRLEVIERMIQIESVQREVLLDIESILHNEFMANYARTHGADTHERMADIFNRIDRDTMADIFTDLDAVMPDSTHRIRQLMFTFEDLLRLDRVSLQAVIRRCDTGQLAIALKGAEALQRDHFLSVLSERARMILQDEIENMGPVRMRDVNEAQAEIVQVAKAMADDGAIVLPQSDEADAVVCDGADTLEGGTGDDVLTGAMGPTYWKAAPETTASSSALPSEMNYDASSISAPAINSTCRR